MIDWHSHILPAIDDGSQDLQESLEMVNALGKQGVDTVVATPHFFANDNSVEEFLEKREASYDLLKSNMQNSDIHIVQGAEVRYYSGIGKLPDLKRLRIGESKLLLLEMPANRWTEYTVKELVQMSGHSGIKIMLAHVERYFGLQSRDVLERLYDAGILMQVNASYFTNPFTKRKAINELANGLIHFIGSDCHNMQSRPPNIDKALDNISKKLGNNFITLINEHGYGLLGKINI